MLTLRDRLSVDVLVAMAWTKDVEGTLDGDGRALDDGMWKGRWIGVHVRPPLDDGR